jgi:hypothetical protein
MTYLDRDLQRRLLTAMADVHPEPLICDQAGFDSSDRAWTSACTYLRDLGLISIEQSATLNGPQLVITATITARGLDFLQDDGGLSAALSVVTVRLEADTLKQLIAARVEASDAPEAEKSRIRDWLKSAGSEALSQATQRLVEAALDSAGPAAIRLLGTLAG